MESSLVFGLVKIEKTMTRIMRALVLALVLMLALPATAWAISLDGNFDDWAGHAHIDDMAGDGPTANSDLTAFYWASNQDQGVLYFMFERVSAQGATFFAVRIDGNNNGSFHDGEDRLVLVHYRPWPNRGTVSMWVLDGHGNTMGFGGGEWGESHAQGARRAEIAVSAAQLGLGAHQTINMLALAGQAQNLPRVDSAPNGGTITWSPIPILGWVGLGLLVLTCIGYVWHSQGRSMWIDTSSLAS